MAITELANRLQKYYRQAGNKIVFRNGLTLNQLSLLMWEFLGFKEIDSSVLSRVLKGERLFTYGQLLVFSKILKLTSQEIHDLRSALAQDILKRYSIELGFTINLNTTKIGKQDLQRLYQVVSRLRKMGLPQEAIILSSIIEKFPDLDSKILARIYNEKSRACRRWGHR